LCNQTHLLYFSAGLPGTPDVPQPVTRPLAIIYLDENQGRNSPENSGRDRIGHLRSRFEQDYMSRGPKDIHAHLLGDVLIVRLQGVLSAAD
jgi:hypothetical protein